MRIRGWQIDGFGHFADHRENDLPDGLTVFLGPNEAGKSTLLAFLRGMLFGFPTGRHAENRYEPLFTRHMGGKLFIETPEGPYTIQRNGPRKEGFRLFRPDDSPGSESELADLLGHADQGLFKSVFAFSLAELQDLNVHKEEGIKDRIFAGSLQGGRNTARAALTLLERLNAGVFKPRGREVELVKLAKQLDELQTHILAARKRSLEYDELTRQEAALTEALQGLSREQATLQRAIQRHRTLLDVWPQWLERTALQQELQALEAVDRFPDQAEARLVEALSTCKGHAAALSELQLEHAQVVQGMGGISLDETIARIGERIRAQASEVSRFLDWVQGLAESQAQLDRAHVELTAALTALGGWTRERLESFDASIPQVDEVSRWESRLDQGSQRLADASRDVKEAAQRAEAARSAVTELRRRLGDEGVPLDVLSQHEERLVRIKTNYTVHREVLTELRQLEDALRTLEIERQRAPSGEPVALPRPVKLGLWALAALLSGLALWKQLASDVVTSGVLAFAATILAGISFFRGKPLASDVQARRAIQEQHGKAWARHEELAARLKSLESRLREDAGAAGLAESPAPAEIEAHDRSLREARERAWSRAAMVRDLEGAEGQQAEAEARLERASELRGAAIRALGEIEREWALWRQQAGVDEDLTPKGVAQLFQALVSARQFLAAVRMHEASVAALAEKAAAFRGQAIGLLEEAGEALPPGDTQLAHAVGRLHERLTADLEARSRHANLNRERMSLELKVEAKRVELEGARQALAELYAEAGAEDEASFRRRLGVHGRRQELGRSLQEVERILDEQLGRDAEAEELKALLQSEHVEAWRLAVTEGALALEAVARQRDEANQALGRLRDERRKLEEASDVIAREHEYQALLDEFRRQARGWLVRGLAEDMIQEALTEAERTRQPAVLAHASQLFSQVTEQRYLRLAQHEGGEFQVIDHRENRISVDKLSRGTAEQLYLCLRLGLIREFARQSANLPLIMDDVFVNFDPERARRMAELLIAFSSEHQVLLFTCHPQTAELLRDLQPEIRLVSMPRFGGKPPGALERTVAGLNEPKRHAGLTD